jgi:hypothetical protein
MVPTPRIGEALAVPLEKLTVGAAVYPDPVVRSSTFITPACPNKIPPTPLFTIVTSLAEPNTPVVVSAATRGETAKELLFESNVAEPPAATVARKAPVGPVVVISAFPSCVIFPPVTSVTLAPEIPATARGVPPGAPSATWLTERPDPVFK